MHSSTKRRTTVTAVAALLASAFTAGVGLGGPAPAGAVVPPPTVGHTCINTLGSYVGNELTPLDIGLSTSGNPPAVDGQPITLSQARVNVNVSSDYLVALYQGRERGNYQLLELGENELPVEFWVSIKGTNTVEGSQSVYVKTTYKTTVTDPTPLVGPPDVDPTDPTNVSTSDYAGRTSGDESAKPIALSVNLPATTWTPAGTGPVTFSEGDAGSISYPVDIVPSGTPAPETPDPLGVYGDQPEGTIRVDGTSTHNMDLNPYWVKPYGSIFLRIHTLSASSRYQTGTNTNGYGVNLDCVAGDVAVTTVNTAPEGEPSNEIARSAHGAFDPAIRSAPLYGWVTKVSAGAEITDWDQMVNSGSLGRYGISHDDDRTIPFAEAVIMPLGNSTCVNSLFSYVGQELSPLQLDLGARSDAAPQADGTVVLGSSYLDIEVPGEYFLQLYRGRERGNYMLLDIGSNDIPIDLWVAIEGENTEEGTQTVKVSTTLDTVITDPTPLVRPGPDESGTNFVGRNSFDESATAFVGRIELPATTWTPTSGDVVFKAGEPGTISDPVDIVPPGTPAPETPDPLGVYGDQPEGTIRIDGTSTHNMDLNPYWVKPFGSIFARLTTYSSTLRPTTGTNTNGYGVNVDCVLGDISLVPNTAPEGEPSNQVARSAHGAFDPSIKSAPLYGWVTKVSAGSEITDWDQMVNSGAAGRYVIDGAVQEPFAGVRAAFPDVPADHQFAEQITWLVDNGIADGYLDGTFQPSAPVARQGFVKFLYEYADPDFEAPATPSFSDVPTSSPFYAAIEWASSQGIVLGAGDGTFSPTGSVTRQTGAAFLHRYAHPTFEVPSVPSFSDVPTSNTFFEAIEWMAASEITNGYPGGIFDPTRVGSRQVAAAWIFSLAHQS